MATIVPYATGLVGGKKKSKSKTKNNKSKTKKNKSINEKE